MNVQNDQAFLNQNNRLHAETSPYLLQHKDNPVHWYSWGEAAFLAAKELNRPILLSIGYSACHWCHVMAHESFEDDATAELMNKHYINIKVDREERPDIDIYYQQALSLMGQQGGWPLTMFLDDQGNPFWGGTYFPSEAKWGRTSFSTILLRLSETYHNQKQDISLNVNALFERLSKLENNPKDQENLPNAELSEAQIINIHYQSVSQLLKAVDWHEGGIGSAPKFPQVPLLRQFLLASHHYKHDQDEFAKSCAYALRFSLEQMAKGGIYDHVGGGFARYSVDSYWLVPHFEKMLYDNGQLLEIISATYCDLLTMENAPEASKKILTSAIEGTVCWLLAEMKLPSGLFAAALDADSEGIEGKFYVWEEQELASHLSKAKLNLFKQYYDVQPDGNWHDEAHYTHGVNILNLSKAPKNPPSSEDQKLIQEGLKKLFTIRKQRIPPGLDNKILADWNGLVVIGLVRAGLALDYPIWIEEAKLLFQAILDVLGRKDETGGITLSHALNQPAQLEDYANMIRAARLLYLACLDDQYIHIAIQLANQVEKEFAPNDEPDEHETFSGYTQTPYDLKSLLPQKLRVAQDHAVPSGNGVMMGNLVWLWQITGDQVWNHRLTKLSQAFAGSLLSNPLAHVSLLEGHVDLFKGKIIVMIRGDKNDMVGLEMIKLLQSSSNLSLNLILIENNDSLRLNKLHPAYGKGLIEGKTTIYICQNQTCSMPITGLIALKDALYHEAK